MRKIYFPRLYSILLAISIGSISQIGSQPLDIQTPIATQEPTPLSEDLKHFWHKLYNEQSRFGEDSIRFLNYVLRQSQRHFLRYYSQYSDWQDLQNHKKYDCVTATWYYVNLLEYLGFQIEIHETAFHVYLQVKLVDGHIVVIESTARQLIYDSKEVQRHAHYYIRSEGNMAFNHIITKFELLGLVYYNQAVRYFNQQNYEQANDYLAKAQHWYPNNRVESLKSLNNEALSQL